VIKQYRQERKPRTFLGIPLKRLSLNAGRRKRKPALGVRNGNNKPTTEGVNRALLRLLSVPVANIKIVS
jgi:hypothetical protein